MIKFVHIMRLVLCLFANVAFSQNAIQGKILDKQTKKGIQYAKISLNKEVKSISDINGDFSVEGVRPSDTLFVEAIGYNSMHIPISQVNIIPIIYLDEIEDIEKIVVLPKNRKKKYTRTIGDFRNPRTFPLLNNIFYFFSTKNLIVTYIPNNEGKDGFIEKVFIHLYSHNAHLVNPLTKDKQLVRPPETCKVRVRCLSIDANREPHIDLSKEQMIFDISRFRGQWFDIARFNVPFPKEGAFVGLEILDVNYKDGVSPSNVSFPVFKSSTLGSPEYSVGSNSFSKNPKGFFNFGAKVSFFKD